MKGFLFFFVIVLLLQSLSLFANASLEETCDKLKARGDYNFCITSLQVDPGSKNADTQDLAIIATNLAKVNFTHTLEKVTELSKDPKTSPKVKQALEDCSGEYGHGVGDLDKAVGEIKSHDFSGAQDLFAEVLEHVKACQGALREVDASLLHEETEDTLGISTLASQITSLLHV